jgi:superfamily I DNA/RNA helicase
MFGDFSRQAIFEDNENMIEMLEEKTSFIKYKLKVNCRNTKPIGDEIKYVTGFESEEYLWTKADGPPVNYFIYRNEEEELVQLEEIIEKLLKGNIIPQQITILSSKKRKDSVVSLVKKYAINDFIPFENSGITFSTIQAFKGLENSAIIITDVETYQHEKLMYVGLSRARSALIILETKSADTERKKMLMRFI